MDNRTRAALESSIEHWERNVAVKLWDASIGPVSCALCKLFNPDPDDPYTCDGCPVREVTGKAYCIGSPYEEAETVYIERRTERWRAAAQAELDFLISLRPKDEGGNHDE